MSTIQRKDKLTEDVHVKVSKKGKKWLAAKSGSCNTPRGRIVDDLMRAEMLREKGEGTDQDEAE